MCNFWLFHFNEITAAKIKVSSFSVRFLKFCARIFCAIGPFWVPFGEPVTGSHCGPTGARCGHTGVPLGSTGVPLGSHWGASSCLLVPLGCLLVHPGCLLGASWVPPRCLLGACAALLCCPPVLPFCAALLCCPSVLPFCTALRCGPSVLPFCAALLSRGQPVCMHVRTPMYVLLDWTCLASSQPRGA